MKICQLTLCMLLIAPCLANSAEIKATGPYAGPGGFDRGMQSTMYCGNNPESWVRGSASLDTASGVVSLQVQLETDSTTAGPKGKVSVIAEDAAGKTLATLESAELGMGGKPMGGAAIKNFGSSQAIPGAIAARVTQLKVRAVCTGSSGGLWGIDLGDAAKAFQIIVTAVAGS
jgi:hypothetical protein